MILAGLDISTTAIHAALIPIDNDAQGVPPVTFRHVQIPQTKGADPLYRRVERARAMRHTLHDLFHAVDGHEVLLAYVEEPRGRFRNDALTGTFDSVCTAIPTGIVVSGIQPQAWRAELGLPRNLTKAAATYAAQDWLRDTLPLNSTDRAYLGVSYPNEHQAEALLIALAGRQINDRHFRAA